MSSYPADRQLSSWMCLALCCACLSLMSQPTGAAAPPLKNSVPYDSDAKILHEEGIVVELKPIRQFLLDRCGNDVDLLRVGTLVKQLGESSFADREDATTRLKGLGPAGLPNLRHALADRDLEVRDRARTCIKYIDQRWPAHVVTAAIRWYLRQRDDAATSVLLRLLPYADEFGQAEEIWFALDHIAANAKQMNSAVRAAIADPVPLRRAAGAYLLARWGNASTKWFFGFGRLSSGRYRLQFSLTRCHGGFLMGGTDGALLHNGFRKWRLPKID